MAVLIFRLLRHLTAAAGKKYLTAVANAYQTKKNEIEHRQKILTQHLLNINEFKNMITEDVFKRCHA